MLLSIAGGGIYAWRRQVAAQEAEEATAAAAKIAAEKARLESGAEVSFTGGVVARNVLAIPAPMDAVVESVEVDVGSAVEQDQPLARLRNEGLAAGHESAKLDLEQAAERVTTLESALISARLEASRAAADAERARSDADRLDRALRHETLLYKEGATPRLKYEKAQKDAKAAADEAVALAAVAEQAANKITKVTADLETAKRMVDERTADLEGSQAEIDAAIVTAPVDGVIISVGAKPGDEVTSAGADLFQLAVAADELAVYIEPDPAVAEKFQDGLLALVNLLELQLDGVQGELKRDDKGKWRIEFKAPDPNVKPGLHAVVRLKLP